MPSKFTIDMGGDDEALHGSACPVGPRRAMLIRHRLLDIEELHIYHCDSCVMDIYLSTQIQYTLGTGQQRAGFGSGRRRVHDAKLRSLSAMRRRTPYWTGHGRS